MCVQKIQMLNKFRSQYYCNHQYFHYTTMSSVINSYCFLFQNWMQFRKFRAKTFLFASRKLLTVLQLSIFFFLSLSFFKKISTAWPSHPPKKPVQFGTVPFLCSETVKCFNSYRTSWHWIKKTWQANPHWQWINH